jgi:hypothetical protein
VQGVASHEGYSPQIREKAGLGGELFQTHAVVQVQSMKFHQALEEGCRKLL